MTDAIARLRELAEQATPGPWKWVGREGKEAAFAWAAPGSVVIGDVLSDQTAAHITAWSPERALAALDVLEAAHRALCECEDMRGALCPQCALRAALKRFEEVAG